MLDETPIGNFAELEGPTEWIDRTLEALGVDPASCLTESYGTLFLAWKPRTGSGAENLPFDEVGAPVLAVSLLITAVALATGGTVVGRLTGRSLLRSGLRQLLFGAVAVGITFGVGTLIGHHGG